MKATKRMRRLRAMPKKMRVIRAQLAVAAHHVFLNRRGPTVVVYWRDLPQATWF